MITVANAELPQSYRAQAMISRRFLISEYGKRTLKSWCLLKQPPVPDIIIPWRVTDPPPGYRWIVFIPIETGNLIVSTRARREIRPVVACNRSDCARKRLLVPRTVAPSDINGFGQVRQVDHGFQHATLNTPPKAGAYFRPSVGSHHRPVRCGAARAYQWAHSPGMAIFSKASIRSSSLPISISLAICDRA